MFTLGEAGVQGAGELVTVTHFTDAAGMDAIASGTLNPGTYVTLPSEVSGMSSAEVEKALEIQSGRGAFSTTFQTPELNLSIPPNGPTTSDGAVRYILNNPTPAWPWISTP